MSGLLLAAALLLVATGLAHSGLGEMLLLLHLGRLRPLPPPLGGERGGARSLCAAWHHLTIFAWTYAVLLIHYASLGQLGSEEQFVVRTISVSLLLGAFLWFAVTRGRHLGWAAILLAALLCRVAVG